MPNRETRRAAAKNGTDITLTMTIDGRVEHVDLMEFSALDEDDFEDVTGMGIFGLVDLIGDVSKLRLKHIAALVWVHRRHREPDITYAEVAAKVTMRDLLTVDVADEESEAASPPA